MELSQQKKLSNLIYKIVIGFIFIIFSIASWDAFEIIVDQILGIYNANTNVNRLFVFIIVALITLAIITMTKNLDLLADQPKERTLFTKLKQIFIGIAFIILWIAIWL